MGIAGACANYFFDEFASVTLAALRRLLTCADGQNIGPEAVELAHADPGDPRQLALAEMHSTDRHQRIFVFRGRHPEIDSIVEGLLRERFELVPGQGLKCSEAAPYFKEVSIYR